MAARGPTRPLLQEVRVIDVSNENVPGHCLLLEMAFQTKRRVALIQQALVHGAMRGMTNRAPLPDRFVFVNKWTALLRVTLEAGFISAQERKSASMKPLLNVRLGAFGGDPFVRLMTIAAAHLAFEHRMMMRKLKCRANVQVALETGVWRLSRIDDRARTAAGLNV